MDQKSAVDFIALDAQVATVVSDDDMFANEFPLSGSVKLLIDPAVEAKSGLSHSSTK